MSCLYFGEPGKSIEKEITLLVTLPDVFSVDNALCRPADPRFAGFCISRGADCGNKCGWKASPDEKVLEAKIKELEMKYESDIDEKAIKREAMTLKGISESNKQMLDAATKQLLQPQPSNTSIELNVEPTERD